MKILHVSPGYKPAYVYGGPTISISKMCHELSLLKQEVTVYTTTANGLYELEVPINKEQNVDGVAVYYFRRWTKDHSHFAPVIYLKLWKTVRDFDVIHIHSWWNFISIPAVIICLFRGIHPVISVRGTLSDYSFGNNRVNIKKGFHWLIGKHLLRACHIHVTSEKEKEECSRHLGVFRGYSLPNFLHFNGRESQQLEIIEGSIFRVSILSRIHPVKNLEFVFNCFAQINFDFEIWIIGDGEQDYVDKLKNKSEVLGIGHKVKWMGPKKGRKKFELLASSDLFVQLSLTENFGNAIIEAASVGTPVLVSDQTGAAQYVQELNLGWVTRLDQADVISIIEQIYMDKTGRMQIRRTVPALIQKKFSGKYLTEEYIKAYEMMQK